MPSDYEITAAKIAFRRMTKHVFANADMRAFTIQQMLDVAIDLGVPFAVEAAETARETEAKLDAC